VVEVDGRQVRVRTAGLDQAGSDAPVVVFEAGFMYDGLSRSLKNPVMRGCSSS
jgi:hypothetical protein